MQHVDYVHISYDHLNLSGIHVQMLSVLFLLDFYKTRIDVYLANYDFDNALIYANKGFKLLEVHEDKRQLGFFFEILGVINYSQEKEKERDEAFINAEKLLSKYAKPEENIDINFFNKLLTHYRKASLGFDSNIFDDKNIELSENGYNNIISHIYNYGQNLEKYKNLCDKFDEEGFRDFFLPHLKILNFFY